MESASNGCITLAPLIRGTGSASGISPPLEKESSLVILLAAVAVLSSVAFHSVFEGAAMNFAFLAFPLVIYAAVRFGAPRTSAILAVVLRDHLRFARATCACAVFVGDIGDHLVCTGFLLGAGSHWVSDRRNLC